MAGAVRARGLEEGADDVGHVDHGRSKQRRRGSAQEQRKRRRLDPEEEKNLGHGGLGVFAAHSARRVDAYVVATCGSGSVESLRRLGPRTRYWTVRK
ncbi:hypothetical protein PG994_014889 [Apiospora phragmitis]|uniref:Uncharacterized protein n=1 Tax=Apiospora phragmitis TaxID=2905665 RepID=A0ABR1SV75_9PEZI